MPSKRPSATFCPCLRCVGRRDISLVVVRVNTARQMFQELERIMNLPSRCQKIEDDMVALLSLIHI